MTSRAEKQRRKQALREAELAHQARRQHWKHRWLNVFSSLCQLLGGACLLTALLLDAAWNLDAVWLSFALWTAAAWLSWYLAPGGTSSFVWGQAPGLRRVVRYGSLRIALVLSGITLLLTLILLG